MDQNLLSGKRIAKTNLMYFSLLRRLYHFADRTRHIARRTHHYYSHFGLTATICKVPLAIYGRVIRAYVSYLSNSNNTSVRYRLPHQPAGLLDRLAAGVQRLAVVAPPNEWELAKIYYPDLWPMNVRTYDSAAMARAAIENDEHDCLLLLGGAYSSEFVELFRRGKNRYVPIIYWLKPDRIPCSTSVMDCQPHEVAMHWQHPTDVVQLIHASDFILCPTRESYDLASRERARSKALNIDIGTEQLECRTIWERTLIEYKRLHFPKVSIVTILYNKASEIVSVLESYSRQTYEGPIELIFVDDQSPDQAAAIVHEFMEQLQQATAPRGRIKFRIVRNDRNQGNCVSRNVGIVEATGDIVVVVDADCLLNADFVRRHVEAHAFDDCEIVIGPLNIETNGAEPMQVLKYYEEQPWLALSHAGLQDPVNRVSFLNCVTRNFSIKVKAITEELFDPRYTYSADPESGYGWEDIEMGYRLYCRGFRIKFVEEAFAVHVTPVHDDNSAAKCLRSTKNFRRLYEKHPEMGWVARRWSRETFEKICEWADKTGAQANEDRRSLDEYFLKLNGPPAIRLTKKRYRVLSYRWHVPHQYELYKLPIDVTLVTGLGSPMTDSWDYSQRPLPANVRFARVEDIDTRDYDLAILHFDENVLAYGNTNGVIGPEWGAAFTWIKDNVDLPKVAICHGTPQFYGQYNIEYSGADLLKVIEVERARLVDYLGDILVVLNSHQAQGEWRFRNSRVIWHGFDPTEFPPATYERGILSPLGPLVMSRPHYRGYFLYKQVFDDFPADLRPESLHVPEPHVLYSGNAYAIAKYRNYIDEIRRYSVYFNPTQRSPMPRARCEPMMCGVVTVSAQNHDVDMFIRNGVNGFYANDPEDLRRILIDLTRNARAARQIGAESRKTAIDIFNHDRYLADWRKVLSDTIG
jgi:glycosyltransferase involved in cell wall biosynthesis